MPDLTYGEIERQIVEKLPELRQAAEYYWKVEGVPGSDNGPYIFFESMLGAYVTILLAMPDSPKRDRMLQRAFDLAEAMLLQGDDAVRNLAFIGLLESRGAWWWRRAQLFMGPAAQRELDTYQPWWRGATAGLTADDAEFIDLYGVRPVIARELAEESISLDHVPGTTIARDPN
jgi:hypothetical protein